MLGGRRLAAPAWVQDTELSHPMQQRWAGLGHTHWGGPCWAPWGHGLLSPGRRALSSDSPQDPPLSQRRVCRDSLRPTCQPPLSIIRLSTSHPRVQVGSLRGRGAQGGSDYRECGEGGRHGRIPSCPSWGSRRSGSPRPAPPSLPLPGGRIQLPKGTLLGGCLPLPTPPPHVFLKDSLNNIHAQKPAPTPTGIRRGNQGWRVDRA